MLSLWKIHKANIKNVNNYSGIGAAVRTMIDGEVVKTNDPTDDYLKEEDK